jgi:UDP-N-acetylglucosamine--N-acetylmuramyl-(pentapeptide) pyrophosphoryl-undecaprenol N-acetylglucosamine transferase
MITDEEVRSKLMPTIVELSGDVAKQNELKTNIGKLAVKNADEIIAREILTTIA